MKTIAIIGLGAVVRNIHVPAYRRIPAKVSIVAGCDPDAEVRDFAREKLSIPEVFPDARAMLDRIRPDIVSVCTPPRFHPEHVSLGLAAGADVFCEKPFAPDLKQADELVDASEKANRLLVVNNQFRRMNIHSLAKRAIGSPEFGKLLHLHGHHIMRDHADEGWRGAPGRGICSEFVIHILDLVRFFFEADPVRLMAHMPNPLGNSRSDLLNVISMEFADGRGASIVADRYSNAKTRYLDLCLDGERAAVHTSIGGQANVAVGLHTRERRPYLEVSFAAGGRAVLECGLRRKTLGRDGVNPFATATALHFEQFVDCIGSGRQPDGNARDNRRTLALVEAAYKSAASRRWVDLSEFDSKPRARPIAEPRLAQNA